MSLLTRLSIIVAIGFGSQSAFGDEHKHERKHKHEHNVQNESTHAEASKPKRSHGAHEHGVVEVSLATEGQQARLTWDSPAESVYGFEHSANTAAQKKQKEEGLAKLKDEFFTMFGFAADAGCKITKSTVEVKSDHEHGHGHGHDEDEHAHGKQHHEKGDHGSHAEVGANFDLTCSKDLAGTAVTVNIAQVFPNVKKVRLTVLSGTKQTATNLSQGKGVIKL